MIFFKEVQTCTFLAVSNSADFDPKVFLVYVCCLLQVKTRRKKELVQILYTSQEDNSKQKLENDRISHYFLCKILAVSVI